MGAGRVRGLRSCSSPIEAAGRRSRRARRRRRRRRGDRRPRRRRPPRPPASRPAARALAVARPDRQRPDRRDGGPLGGRWASTGSSDALGLDRARRRRRLSSAATDRPRRASSSAHEACYTARADGGVVRRGDASTSPTPWTTSRGSGRSSRSGPALEDLEWFGTGPHETYPDRRRSGLVGRWESTVTDQLRPVHPAAGERRPRRRPLAGASRRGRRAACGSTSTAAPGLGDAPSRRRPRRRRPTTSTSSPRPETIVHLDAAHRGLGTASCGPDTLPEYLLRPRPYTLGAGRCGSVGRPDDVDRLDRRTPASSTSATSTISYVVRVHENGSLGHLHFGRRSRLGRSYATSAWRVRGLLEPRRRTGRPRVPDDRQRRLSESPAVDVRARRRLDRPRPRLRRATGSSPASRRSGRRPAALDLRRGRRRGRHARRHPGRRSRAGSPVDLWYTLFRDRPVVARSARIRNDGDAAVRLDGRDERDARPARRRLGPRPAERQRGPARTTSSSAASGPAAVSSAATAGRRATSTTRSSPSPRDHDRGRRRGVRVQPRLLGQLPRRGRGRPLRHDAASGSASPRTPSPGRSSRATRSDARGDPRLLGRRARRR